MPISWNEIRQNAIRFAADWAGAKSESAEKQTFWNEFFAVFGMRRRAVASFEEPVKQISGTYGRIDLFWKGMLLVEHKSRGQDLGKAESQAFQYIQDLLNEGRQDEVPRYVIVSDFARFALYDLEPEDERPLPLFAGHRVETTEFALADLHRNVHLFAFIAGYQQHRFKDHDPINLKAVAIMDDLHDALEAGGYKGHDLERFLVRILFCLFAQCTGIFEREAFRLFIEDRTKPDGSDLGRPSANSFSPCSTRLRTSGRRISMKRWRLSPMSTANCSPRGSVSPISIETCATASWPARGSTGRKSRRPSSVRSSRGRWSRRSGGNSAATTRASATFSRSCGGLFLDDLRAEFERIKGNKNQLKQFHQKIAGLRFLDPACGCGNFLVITYRELRLLEIEILKLLEKGQQHLNIQSLSLVDVDAFYGIEIDEWPARIAEVAMWLMDHQMNIRLVRGVRPVLRPPAADEVADDRLRQRAALGLEGDSAARKVQLCAWAIRRLSESSSWTAGKARIWRWCAAISRGMACSTT